MTSEQKLNIFKRASLSRKFEDHVFNLIKQKYFNFPLYLSAGQEFIPATISEFFKDKSPFIFGQHRAHSTYLSFGGDINELIDELKGKSTGCAGGMGGSASIQSKKIGMFGHDGLMGTQVPIAVGACFSSNKLTITIAGDAAAEEDYVMAAIAWAGTKKLPIVFVIEDNNLSILTEKKVRRNWEMHEFAKSVNVNAVNIEDKPELIWDSLKNNQLPLLLNIQTNRLFWHAGAGIDDPNQKDRYKLEMEEIGEEAKIIDTKMKLYVEEMWK
jgi:pyruvate dehydrogenase E1 component alpha subunit